MATNMDNKQTGNTAGMERFAMAGIWFRRLSVRFPKIQYIRDKVEVQFTKLSLVVIVPPLVQSPSMSPNVKFNPRRKTHK